MTHANRRLATLTLALSFAVPAAAQQAAPPAAGAVPPQPQIINLSLLDALIAVRAQDLAGVFGYIAEPNAAPAFADYLVHNRSALKRFVNRGEKDLKEIGGVNEWDRQVFLYVLAIHASGVIPDEKVRLSESWVTRISALSLAPALPLDQVTLRRRK